ncbi:MAG: hypothetical protein WCO00_03520 [Rhodospirillaceae bacterium]
MKIVLFFVGAFLLSSPVFAQTQSNDPQYQSSSGPVTIGSALFTIAGVAGGIVLADYALGGTMALRLIGGVAPGMRPYGGLRGFPLGTGLVRGLTLAGSGLLGGYLARTLSK